MKLYVHQGACSLSPHIIARELDIDIDVIHVDRRSHKTGDGLNFLEINPNGYVPALVLDDGEIVLEGPAIVQYLMDLKPEAGWTPKTLQDRRRLQSLLNFISTEIHKPLAQAFSPVYAPVKDVLVQHASKRLDWIVTQFKGDYITGSQICPADAYLFVCLNWSQWLGIDVERWPTLTAFMRRMLARPKVVDALAAENLAPLPGSHFFAPRPAPQERST